MPKVLDHDDRNGEENGQPVIFHMQRIFILRLVLRVLPSFLHA